MAVNAMQVSPQQAFDTLLAFWEAQKAKKILSSIMLHGEPGVGKTWIVEKLARMIGAKFYDVRLTTIDTSDLRGLPYYCHETKTTQWYRPQDLPDDPTQPAVLFLDELTSAEPHLQPTVYGLLQERRVGPHQLPDNVIIIGAGNGTGDGAVAYEMGTAIANRLVHMVVTQDPESWVNNFAIPEGLHPAVIALIKINPSLLHTIQQALDNDDLVASTGRSWHRVSDILYAFNDPLTRNIAVAGSVGTYNADQLFLVLDDVEASTSVMDMVKVPRHERAAMYPKTLNALNALVYGTVGLANKDNLHACIEVLVDIATLKEKRTEDEFRIFPLKELTTHGMESLMTKVEDFPEDVTDIFLDSEAYQAYHAERQEDGLASAA